MADIGGGTSDFSVVRVSPERAGRATAARDILGSPACISAAPISTEVSWRPSCRCSASAAGCAARDWRCPPAISSTWRPGTASASSMSQKVITEVRGRAWRFRGAGEDRTAAACARATQGPRIARQRRSRPRSRCRAARSHHVGSRRERRRHFRSRSREPQLEAAVADSLQRIRSRIDERAADGRFDAGLGVGGVSHRRRHHECRRCGRPSPPRCLPRASLPATHSEASRRVSRSMPPGDFLEPSALFRLGSLPEAEIFYITYPNRFGIGINVWSLAKPTGSGPIS